MKTRFVKSVIETSKTATAVLPFQRGARRAAFIAKLKAPEHRLKSA